MSQYEVFVSHASEDKLTVVVPLVDALKKAGLTKVWVDYQELQLGDSLGGKINQGLSQSDFGIVILSPAFVRKDWPNDELKAMQAAGKRVLPIRYGLSQDALARALPLIADRVSVAVADDLSNLPKVVDSIAQVVRPSLASNGSPYAVDFSHGQQNWDFLPSAIDHSPVEFRNIAQSWLELPQLLTTISVLIIPPPFHISLTQPEMNSVAEWVDRGGGLLIMGCYGERHHASNFSQLAWRFDLDFQDDLILPAGKSSADREQVRSRDLDLAVQIKLAAYRHPITEGVAQIALLSGSSILWCSLKRPELVVESPPDSIKKRPVGHIDPDGSRPSIDGWFHDRDGSFPMFVARSWGRGRVAAAATWKLFTVDCPYNASFLNNVLKWLARDQLV